MEIERAMAAAVRKRRNIKLYPHAFVTSLLNSGSRCVGAQATISGLGERRFQARTVMLATGGCGKMYQHTTNPPVATADGIALAAAANAKIEDMEFMQFHPTTLYHPQARSFLISEAVRGAGGTLRNHLGQRFMRDYDERLELAPRDIVARAIEAEMRRLDTWCVYLDTTHLEPEMLRAEFPTIHERLASIGILMEKDWIPVVPAQHYSCGGVKTDLEGRTDVKGLFAAGEVASTGVHGANRLASNSLLEAIVFARSAGVAARDEPSPGSGDPYCEPGSIVESESVLIRRAFQHVMTANVGIVRSNASLQLASTTITELSSALESQPNAPFSQHALETRNLLTAARFVVDGAIARRVNVGLHFNSDQAGSGSAAI